MAYRFQIDSSVREATLRPLQQPARRGPDRQGEPVTAEMVPAAGRQLVSGAPADYAMLAPFIVVAPAVKAIMQGLLAPGEAQFFPVDVMDPDGATRLAGHFALNPTLVLDCIDRAGSEGSLELDETGRPSHWEGPVGPLRQDAVAGHHLWLIDHAWDFLVMSDALHDALRAAPMRGLRATHIPETGGIRPLEEGRHGRG